MTRIVEGCKNVIQELVDIWIGFRLQNFWSFSPSPAERAALSRFVIDRFWLLQHLNRELPNRDEFEIFVKRSNQAAIKVFWRKKIWIGLRFGNSIKQAKWNTQAGTSKFSDIDPKSLLINSLFALNLIHIQKTNLSGVSRATFSWRFDWRRFSNQGVVGLLWGICGINFDVKLRLL